MERDGTMLFHPTEKKVGQPVENVVVKGVTKYAGYYVHPSGEFILVLTADEEEIFAPITTMIIKVLIGSLIALVICSVVGILVIWKIVKLIQSIAGAVNQLADMDFRETQGEGAMLLRKDEAVCSLSRSAPFQDVSLADD